MIFASGVVEVSSGLNVNRVLSVMKSRGMEIDDPVRVIRVPYFGKIGKIKALPFSPQALDTEATVRILEVEFPDGTTVIVPRANVEMIEA